MPPKGIVVSGGFYKTWLEQMLEFERNRLALIGRSAGQVNEALRGYAEFQALDVTAAWGAVSVPVLVVHGEFDWIMSLDDQQRIVDTVNRRRPGQARLLVVPRMNHHFELFDSQAAAFADEEGRYAPTPIREAIRWMREVAR